MTFEEARRIFGRGLSEELLLTKEFAPIRRRVASSHRAPRAKVYCAKGTHHKKQPKVTACR